MRIEKLKGGSHMKVQIICDTREQKNNHIIKAFKKHDISFITEKLDIGDYAMFIPDTNHKCKTVYERKASLEELSANLCEPKDHNNHNRFERELIRAKEQGIKVVLCIENPNWYEDLMNWRYRTKLKPKAFRGMLLSLASRYDLKVVGVSKEYIGSFIYNTLYYELREELKGENLTNDSTTNKSY